MLHHGRSRKVERHLLHHGWSRAERAPAPNYFSITLEFSFFIVVEANLLSGSAIFPKESQVHLQLLQSKPKGVPACHVGVHVPQLLEDRSGWRQRHIQLVALPSSRSPQATTASKLSKLNTIRGRTRMSVEMLYRLLCMCWLAAALNAPTKFSLSDRVFAGVVCL